MSSRPYPLDVLLPITFALGLVSIGVVGHTVAAWRKGWWSWPGRLSSTLVGLAAVAFVLVAFTDNLISLPPCS